MTYNLNLLIPIILLDDLKSKSESLFKSLKNKYSLNCQVIPKVLKLIKNKYVNNNIFQVKVPKIVTREL